MSCQENTKVYHSYQEYPIYNDLDLGITYRPEFTVFKLWSPAAEQVKLRFYKEDLEGIAIDSLSLHLTQDGVWMTKVEKDLNWLYYTYQAKFDGEWLAETPDPYAIACGTNGVRSQVINLADSTPIDWDKDKAPLLAQATDMVIYEMHIRDFSIDPNSGIKHKGQYLGITEQNTKTPNGITTGLTHLKEMGVTHVHLLPCFDFQSLDESKPNKERGYNWGYDPHLYNVPEGSYATYTKMGDIRIREFREMVQALHQAGIRVIMDVVYNHTGDTETSVFNQLAPNYYYRQKEDGSFSNASACGNETASERPMVRNFILQSVKHWVKEYHIDGFRFDLMGIHDIETMNAVSQMLHDIDPSIFIYGEGWTGGDSPLPEKDRALKKHTPQLQNIAAFSDDMRDAIKGHVFTANAKAFINGQQGLDESIKFGVAAATQHPQIDYNKVNYSDAPWSPQPTQCINYASCHDNHTLWDRLANAVPDASKAEKIKMQQLALGIVLTSQGVPFLHAGTEFCRTKKGVENSYKSPDDVNLLDWKRKKEFASTVTYVKDLIALRKAHPAFRMTTANQISEHLHFIETNQDNVVAYTIHGDAVGDEWENILVIYNGNRTNIELEINGNWVTVWKSGILYENPFSEMENNILSVPATEMMILIADD